LAISVLLEVSGKRNRCLDVLLLTGFVSTREKDDEFAISFGVVNPVAWPYVDLQLRDSMRQIAMLTRIAVSKPVDSHLYACSGGAVFEPIDPISVDLSDLNAHAEM
jgi:hypothetical protein